MDSTNNIQIHYPVFAFIPYCDVDMFISQQDLARMEKVDVEAGEYMLIYDVDGVELNISINADGTYVLTASGKKPDKANLFENLYIYVNSKRYSNSFNYTGPSDDPVELFRQFEVLRFNHSVAGRIIRLFRKFFGKSTE